MAAACAPSRASLLTGQYPSLHGVAQTDGLGKTPDSEDMFWLAPDGRFVKEVGMGGVRRHGDATSLNGQKSAWFLSSL
jgi:hypothetical protein